MFRNYFKIEKAQWRDMVGINYFKMAWRNYAYHRFFTLLNFLSLTIGLLVAYLAVGYIQFELSYDRFHQNAASIYRLGRTYRSQDYGIVGFPNWNDATPAQQQAQVQALKKTAGVADVVQFIVSPYQVFLQANSRRIEENDVLTTNTPAAFCSVFSWTLEQGSFQDFSAGFNKVILTHSIAQKLFGKDAANDPSVLQKTLKIGDETYAIAAIIADVLLQSHFNFKVAISKPRLDYWGSRLYVQLNPNITKTTAESALNATYAAFDPKLARDPLYKAHFLQSIGDIHLKSNILYELKPPGNLHYLALIIGFALFILVVTVFNYANLSLAMKSKQRKSFGVLKTLGAVNTQLAAQIVFEGVLLAVLALPVVALLVATLAPAFNQLLGVGLAPNVLEQPVALLTLGLLACVLGLLSSVFPAVALSWKSILELLKNNIQASKNQRFSTRKYLIISQFCILIIITSFSYFVTKQIDYVENKPLGFQKEGILYAYTSVEKQDLFQKQLRQLPEVKAVGNGSSFGIAPFNQGTYKLDQTDVIYDDANQLYLDRAALKIYGLQILPANLLSEQSNLPAVFTLINRTAAVKMAQNQRLQAADLIGKTVITEPEYIDQNNRVGVPFVVAGIFDDIHIFSLHQKIAPYFITISDRLRLDGRSIVQYEPKILPQLLKKITAIHRSLGETVPLEIEYLSQNLANLYRQDRQTAQLLFYFNLIAVVLALLGLVGISVFLTIARIKEIGIRKVLGASPFSIVRESTKEYVWLVGVALAVGWPVALFGLQSWLATFAYHIELSQMVFLLIGIGTFLMAVLIVGIIAYRAALMNPVESLKTE